MSCSFPRGGGGRRKGPGKQPTTHKEVISLSRRLSQSSGLPSFCLSGFCHLATTGAQEVVSQGSQSRTGAPQDESSSPAPSPGVSPCRLVAFWRCSRTLSPSQPVVGWMLPALSRVWMFCCTYPGEASGFQKHFASACLHLPSAIDCWKYPYREF